MPTRDLHTSDEWKKVMLEMLADGSLMTDAAQPRDWDSDMCAPVVTPAAPVRHRKLDKTDILEARDEARASEAVHAAARAAAREGTIPVTTLKQRSRNKLSSGCEYVVPEGLRDLLVAGFTHPNLPAPAGLIWLTRVGTWRLKPRCG